MDSYNWEGRVILIVEDDDVSLEFLKELFEPYHVKILAASDGFGAIALCKSEPLLDLVLMDVQLPVMNGKEAMKEIKKIRPGLPIIAQTAFAMSGDKEKYIHDGFDDYISKPINVQELLTTIEGYFKV